MPEEASKNLDQPSLPASSSAQTPDAPTDLPGPSQAAAELAPSQPSSIPALFILTLLALMFFVTIEGAWHPGVDVDAWWHLRVGQWIEQKREWPTTDPFSRHGLETGKPWHAYSWLFEWTLYRLEQAMGIRGLVFLRLGLALTLVWGWLFFLQRRALPYTWMTVLWVFSFMVIGSNLLTERPWLITIAISLWTMDVLLSARAGRWSRAYWCLPLGYMLWANVHIQFIYGLALMGLAVVAPGLDRWLKRPVQANSAQEWRSSLWWKWLALTLLCALATLINPYHFHLYEVVLDYASQTGAFDCVSELQAPRFRHIRDWLAMFLFASAVIACGSRWPGSTFDVLLVAGTAFAGLRAVRDLWYLVLGAVSILSLQTPAIFKNEIVVTFRWPLHMGWLLLAWSLAAGLPWLIKDEEFAKQERLQYPALAVQHVLEQRYPGPLFNHFDWGGYLIWRLPEYPVSMDGRTNLHGDRRLVMSLNTWTGITPLPPEAGKPAPYPDWDQNPDLLSARLVIAQKEMALTNLLRKHAAFHKVYEDDRAVVFIRRRGSP